jgi:hypothetical protein
MRCYGRREDKAATRAKLKAKYCRYEKMLKIWLGWRGILILGVLRRWEVSQYRGATDVYLCALPSQTLSLLLSHNYLRAERLIAASFTLAISPIKFSYILAFPRLSKGKINTSIPAAINSAPDT